METIIIENEGVTIEVSIPTVEPIILSDSGVQGIQGPPGTTDYNELINVPTEFTPSAHTHPISDITDLQDELNGKQPLGSYSPVGHHHTIGDVSGLQDDLDGKQPVGDYAVSTHTHDDRYYTESETDTLLAGKSDTSHTHDDRYYTESETDSLLSDKVDKETGKGLSTNDYTTAEQTKLAGIATGATVNSTDAYLLDRTNHTGSQAISTIIGLQTALDSKASSSHTHDDRYYTETETDTLLSGKSNTGHMHDDRYYTESETDTLLSGKANSSHTHAQSDITNLTTDLAAKVTANTSITSGTKTKITFDSKGLVTGGADLVASDIPTIAQSQVTNLTTDLAGKQATLGYTAENSANKENTTIDTSTTKYPTVNLLKTGLDGKQATLVSGTNIKTVNGTSILGSGDITAGAAWGSIKGTLSSQTDLQSALNAKQNTLTNPVTGTGTSGQLAYWNSGSSVTGSSNLVWDNTNNRLGIGVSSPSYPIHIINTSSGAYFERTGGNAPLNTAYIALKGASGGGGQLRSISGANDGLAFWSLSLSTEYARITSNGNLLLNSVTDAGFRLDVTGTSRFNGSTTFGSIGAATGMFWDNTNNRLGIGTNSPGAALTIVTNGTDTLYLTGYATSASFAPATISRKARGTASSPLAVQTGDALGGLYANGHNGTDFQATNPAAVVIYASQNFTSTDAGTYISLLNTPDSTTSRTERLRLFNSGNVLIQNGGTFTDNGFRLEVVGTARITNKLSLSAGTTSAAQVNYGASTAPTSPVNGDFWFDGTNCYIRVGGVTKTFTLT